MDATVARSSGHVQGNAGTAPKPRRQHRGNDEQQSEFFPGDKLAPQNQPTSNARDGNDNEK